MLAGLGLGCALGLTCNAVARGAPWLSAVVQYGSEPLGSLFLRALLMLVIPLVLCAMVVGVGELPLKKLGRLGALTLGYTCLVSALAATLGLTLVLVLQPGAGASDELLRHARQTLGALPQPPRTSLVEVLVGIIPTNPVQAAASGDLLGFVCFSLLLGVGAAVTKTDASRAFLQAMRGLYDVCTALIGLVLRAAPLGVGALMFSMTAQVGFSILQQVSAYVAVVLLGLALHLFGVYSLLLLWRGKRRPWAFFRDVRLALMTAFSTASSNATLPTALAVADTELRLPPAVSRFVLTAGATMNQNGTALYEGVTVLFLAQVYGVQLGVATQVLVLVISIVGGIGAAGVPAGSLPVIAVILTLVGVPAEGIGLLLGVDRLLDMCRTTVNVAGDLVVAVLVAQHESGAIRAAEENEDASLVS